MLMYEERKIFDDLDEALEAMGQEPVEDRYCQHGFWDRRTDQGRPYEIDSGYFTIYKDTITDEWGEEHEGLFVMYEENGKYVVELNY